MTDFVLFMISFVIIMIDRRSTLRRGTKKIKKIYKLCIVHFSAGKVVVDQTKYFMNTGYEVLQGINYSDKYGLFIVYDEKTGIFS